MMEGLDVGTVVGNLFATDTDSGDSHTYSLVDGEGAAHNNLFRISGDELQVGGSISGKTVSVANILVSHRCRY